MKAGYRIRICAGFLILFSVIMLSLCFGRYRIEFSTILGWLQSTWLQKAFADQKSLTVLKMRFARIVLNVLVGGGLAACGVTFQSTFQNRLVGPDILGVSSGAAFGAALGIFVTDEIGGITLCLSFIGGTIAMVMVYGINQKMADKSVLTIVLSGMVVGAVFNALLSCLKLVADTNFVLPAITYWLMGSFAGTDAVKVMIAGIPILTGYVLLYLCRWKMNLLSMGDEEALNLGINPVRMRWALILACTLITCASVMVTGIIGWVGMLIPNITRRLYSADTQYLLPMSTIIGAIFMVCADFFARTLTQAEIPIGIITALIGAPFFIFIYNQKNTGVNDD